MTVHRDETNCIAKHANALQSRRSRNERIPEESVVVRRTLVETNIKLSKKGIRKAQPTYAGLKVIVAAVMKGKHPTTEQIDRLRAANIVCKQKLNRN